MKRHAQLACTLFVRHDGSAYPWCAVPEAQSVTAGRLNAQGVGKAVWMPLHVGSDGALILEVASRDQEACLLQGDIKVQVTSSGLGAAPLQPSSCL